MKPVVEKSKLPKIIFVSSEAGSIGAVLNGKEIPPSLSVYGASKAAANYLMAVHGMRRPHWKVNAVCPGARSTGIRQLEEREDTHPALGAVRVLQLVQEGPGGVTGTFSNSEGLTAF